MKNMRKYLRRIKGENIFKTQQYNRYILTIHDKRWMVVIMIINSHDIALDISLIHSKLCWSDERSELNGALSQEYLKARNSMIE